MSKRLKCPNCNSPVAKHPENGCLLAALIRVAHDRGVTSERKLRKLHAGMDVMALWDVVGPLVDDIEEGRFQRDGD